MDNHQTNAVNTMNLTDNSQGTSWQLIGLSPALADLTIDIDKSLSIGRSDSNDLVLAPHKSLANTPRLTVLVSSCMCKT